jgi:hypothetical protein
MYTIGTYEVDAWKKVFQVWSTAVSDHLIQNELCYGHFLNKWLQNSFYMLIFRTKQN